MEIEVKANLVVDYDEDAIYYNIKCRNKGSWRYKNIGNLPIFIDHSWTSTNYFRKQALEKINKLSEDDIVRKISEYVQTHFINKAKNEKGKDEFERAINKYGEIKITVKID